MIADGEGVVTPTRRAEPLWALREAPVVGLLKYLLYRQCFKGCFRRAAPALTLVIVSEGEHAPRTHHNQIVTVAGYDLQDLVLPRACSGDPTQLSVHVGDWRSYQLARDIHWVWRTGLSHIA